jgi:hypothetical protein
LLRRSPSHPRASDDAETTPTRIPPSEESEDCRSRPSGTGPRTLRRCNVAPVGVREHTQWAMSSSLPPDAVIRALTDFGDDRSRIWPETSHPAVYRVHALGPSWAEVTEGVPFSWSRERYDWSTPGVVTLAQLESNVANPRGGRIVYTVRSAPSGSRIECDRRRNFRATPRGLIAAAIMRTIGPRLIRQQFARSLDRVTPATTKLVRPFR